MSDKSQEPKKSVLDRKLGLPAVFVLVGLILASMLGLLDGPWVGIFVGLVFASAGLVGLFNSLFGRGDFSPFPIGLLQRFGGLLLSAVMIFLGGLGLVSGTTDKWPSTVWSWPWLGDLRTLFWAPERFTLAACHYAKEGPPEALIFMLERSPQKRFSCLHGLDQSLLELTDDVVMIDALLAHARFDQADLDHKLLELCRIDQRPAIASLLEHGANPNRDIAGESALSAAFNNHKTSLVAWLLENGAQANFTYQTGETQLERAKNTDVRELGQIYVDLLLRHGATEKPKLEISP